MRMRDSFTALGLSSALALGLGFGAASAQDLAGQAFVFGGFGGDLQANQDIAWLQPFAAATGVTINQTDSPDMATLATQQEAGNVLLDVIQIEASTVDANCGTAFMEVQIDRAELNTAMDSNTCGVPVVKFSYVLAYNAATYPDGPTSVADFFDTERFPGVRAIRAGSNVGIIETALMADGVAAADLYPVDLDRAVARIEAIVDSIEVKESFAVIQDGLANGEFDMALVPNGRAFNAFRANPDIRAVFDGAVTLYDNLVIPTGAQNVEAATAFLQYVALHSTQSALTQIFPYGMGTVGEAPALDEQAASFFPDSYADQLLLQDAGWWAENDAAVNDRLTALFAQ